MKFKFCPSCGTERIGEFPFCAKCGSNLEQIANPQTPIETPETEIPEITASEMKVNDIDSTKNSEMLSAQSTHDEPLQAPAPTIVSSTWLQNKLRITIILLVALLLIFTTIYFTTAEMKKMPNGTIAVNGNWVYYVEFDLKGVALYRSNKNGLNKQKLASSLANERFFLEDDLIYYASNDGNVHKMQLDGSGDRILCNNNGMKISHFFVDGDWLFFQLYEEVNNEQSFKDGIYRLKSNGTELTNHPFDSNNDYFIYGGWIYYFENDNSKGLYRMKNDFTGAIQKISDDFVNIGRTFIQSDRIFYSNIVENNNFSFISMNTDGTDRKELFRYDTQKTGYPTAMHQKWVLINGYNLDGQDTNYRIKMDGTMLEEIQTMNSENKSGSALIIDVFDERIYYQIFDYNANEIELYHANLDGSDPVKFN